jgi:predicted permease
MGRLWRRIAFWLRRDRIEAELREEIEAHRQLRRDALAFHDAAEPEAESYRALGNTTLAIEDARGVWIWPWLESVLSDIRHGARSLRRQPSFSLTALLTIAVGSGALMALVALVYTVLLRPAPYANANRIVQITQVRENRPRSEVPSVDIDALRQSGVFEGVTISYNSSVSLTGDSLPETARAIYTDRYLFPVLGTPPVVGRWPGVDDEAANADPIVVISHRLWERRFGARPDVIGARLGINGRMHTVIAVMPETFQFPAPYFARGELWIFRDRSHPSLTEPERPLVVGFGLLREGESVARAQIEADTIAQRLVADYPASHANTGIRLTGWGESSQRASRPILMLLLGAAACVFLIVCINIFNLLLCRSLDRSAEMATRTALGAGGGRLVRHVLTETIVLFGMGGAAGAWLAIWMVKGIVSVGSFDIPRMAETSLDWRVALAGWMTTIIAGVVVGLPPALRAAHGSSGQTGRLQTRAVTHGRRGRRMQRVLIAAEIGLAVLLMCGAGAIALHASRFGADKSGFEAGGLTQARVSLPREKYPDIARQSQFFTSVLERLRTRPNIMAAGVVDLPPGVGGAASPSVLLDGDRAPAKIGDLRKAALRVVSDGYLETLGLSAREGRLIRADDRAEPPIAVVNEAFVREFLNAKPAIGSRLRVTFDGLPQLDALSRAVVGVVPDVREDTLYRPAPPTVYVPISQADSRRSALVVRGRPGADVNLTVRESLAAVDPDQAVAGLIMPLDALMEGELDRSRLSLTLIGGLAAVAVILAVVGVYGVVAHGVRHRSREIGIRLALGVSPASVRRMVIREGGALLAAGVLAGGAAALWLAPLVRSLVLGVERVEMAVPLLAAAAIATMTVLAGCDIPARRAAKVDPVSALKSE